MNRSRCVSPFATISLLTVLTTGLAACSGGAGSSLPGSNVSTLPSTTQSSGSSVSTLSTSRHTNVAVSGEMPLSADSLAGDHDANNNFIDSVGVNTKLNSYGTNPYANYAQVKSALVGLGVRHIRDVFNVQNLNNYENNLADLAHNGVHSELLLTISEDANNNAKINVSGAQAAAYLQAGHFAQSIEVVEGINEPDVNQGAPNNPPPNGWVGITQTEQKNLYLGIQALTPPAKRIPVYGPSVGQPADFSQVGDLSQYMDYGNIHDYSGGYNLLPSTISSMVTSEATISSAKPVVASENGYSIGTTGQGMPNSVMLDYAERMFFKQFANNVKRTMWYEFLDENTTPNDYWNNAGLLTAAYVPKPAYVGLKNVLALLKDQTPYTQRTPLNVAFGSQGAFENLTHLLLQKNDGSYWLAVWSDVSEWNPAANGSPGSYVSPAPATYANSINFLGTYVASMTEYDQDATGAITSKSVTVSNGTSAQVNIGARPTLFKIVPGVALVVPVAPTIANPAAHYSLDEGSGTVAGDSVDSTGNMIVPTPGQKLAWISGPYNAALSMNGTQAETSKTVIDTSQSYSATAWVEMSSLSGYQAAVAVNGLNQAAFALDYTPQSNLSFTTYPADGPTNVTRIGSKTAPVIGKWYAVAATFNGSTRLMSFYLNGVLQGTATASQVFKAAGTTEIGSMKQAGVGHFQWWFGGVDDVNFYQRELTPAEVATMAGP